MVKNISAWARGTEFLEPEALGRDLATEVCIVGAGIAGVTTAYLLAKEGVSVAVLERGALLSGQTRNTTAHLSNAIDDRYSLMEQMHGAHGARLAAESHSAAIDRIERIVAEEKIECDFARVDGYLFLGEGQKADVLEEELEAARRAGLAGVEKLEAVPVRGFSSGPCLRFPRQGQFHPLKYLRALIGRCEAMDVRFFANTPVEDVAGGAVAMVKMKSGFTVKAKAAVVTTNSPINNRVKLHSKLYPYLTFVIGGLVEKGAVERALFWDTLEMYHYVRLQDWDEGRDLLIVGGADHKTGHRDDAAERYGQLEAWARQRFPAMGEVVLRWSGQVLETPDGLAYIGKNPGEENVYLCTGDSGMGMTHGTISAILNTDLIQGRRNDWATLYDPKRKTLRGLPGFAEENLDVALKYGDYFKPGRVESEEEIAPGSGAVVRRGLAKVAVYRDELGKLHRRSAVCPHLGCIVAWNSDKRTWDCPCHGSRFDPLGRVVNGPSVSDLGEAS